MFLSRTKSARYCALPMRNALGNQRRKFCAVLTDRGLTEGGFSSILVRGRSTWFWCRDSSLSGDSAVSPSYIVLAHFSSRGRGRDILY